MTSLEFQTALFPRSAVTFLSEPPQQPGQLFFMERRDNYVACLSVAHNNRVSLIALSDDGFNPSLPSSASRVKPFYTVLGLTLANCLRISPAQSIFATNNNPTRGALVINGDKSGFFINLKVIFGLDGLVMEPEPSTMTVLVNDWNLSFIDEQKNRRLIYQYSSANINSGDQ